MTKRSVRTEMDLPSAQVALIPARRFADSRGYFSETYNRERFSAWGIDLDFLQDNQSYSKNSGTVRGLHFQAPPYAQAKLVRVLRGRIMDAVVDIRQGSPTYGRHVTVELSSADGSQLFVPVGYLHGFVTLEPDTEVAYKTSALYAPSAEGGVHWRDPHIGIDWGVAEEEAVISEKDAILPRLADIESPFQYEGAPLELKSIA
jgi:dTDP-4-dehydrorhamnose 3,5-epimerase